MAENHIVDSKDQHEPATGVTDHSELTSAYRDAPKKELGAWMQEDERQIELKKELDKIQTGLRTSVIPVGFSISAPVVLGILIGQYAKGTADLKGNPTGVFILILIGIIGLLVILGLFRYVFSAFAKHNIRALPITITTLGTLLCNIQNVFDYFDAKIGGLYGYGAALGAILVGGMLISAILIFIWSSPKVPGIIKLFVLLAFLGGSAAYAYL